MNLLSVTDDLVIVDESHCLGAFPKPSVRTKSIKEIVGSKYCILLSGTPTPESWSQIFHQFWISEYCPFPQKSFYAWAKSYVNVTKRNSLIPEQYCHQGLFFMLFRELLLN